MAKGKKEDPNKVAQRKAERVAFVKSRPDLAPDVARKRFYVQTRAQELEAAGKPVDRAALRQKFETGGVTREGFYTPADIARINAKKDTNGQSLAQSKTSTPQPVVPGAPVKPPTTTTPSAPKKRTPQRPPDRIENKVMIAGARQTSPDVMEARKKVSARPMTPITDAQFKAQVDAENAKLYEDLVKKYGGNEKLAQSAYGLMARGSERTSKVEDVLFGRGVSFKTAAKEATGVPQIARGFEGIKSGEGVKGKARGALDVGLGAFTVIGNLLTLRAGGMELNARFRTKAITPRYELPPARGGVVESLEAGKNFKPTDARQTYYDYPAGPPTPPKSRLDVAADLQKKRAAEVEAAKAPSLHDAKQAELQKMVDETPLNIETPTKTKGKSKGKAKVDKLINEQGGAVKMGQEYGPARPARASDADILDAMEQADFARMEGVDVVEAPRPNKKKGRGKKVEVKKAEEVADDFEFDASTMEMSSTERATGDAYLYDPKADLSNLADVKVQVKGKGKGKGKKNTEPVAEAVTETAKPASKSKTASKKKTKSDVKVAYPEGAKPQRQTIARDIEIKGKQGTVPGQTEMGQAASRNMPVQGEIPNVFSLAEKKAKSTRRTVKISGIDVVVEGSGTLADPTRVVGRPLKGESMLEVQFPREAPTGTPRRMPEPPAEKIAPKPVRPPRRRGVIKVEPYQPPAGAPVRITREQANRAVRVREAVAKELEKDPFGTGSPRPIRSSMGNLPEVAGGVTEAQVRAKGGRPKKETFTTMEEKAQAAIEMTMSGTSRQMSVQELKSMAFEDINRISRWLTKKRMQSVAANPEAPSTALNNLREIIGQAKASRMLENAAEFEATGGQQKYFDMVTNPRSSAKRPTAESKAAEAEGKLMSDLNDIRQQTANQGSRSGPSAKKQQNSVRRHMPTIERLQPKVDAGTATNAQVRELVSAYEGIARGAMDPSIQSQWRSKADALKGIMGKK